jgi:hypothetical protein
MVNVISKNIVTPELNIDCIFGSSFLIEENVGLESKDGWKIDLKNKTKTKQNLGCIILTHKMKKMFT